MKQNKARFSSAACCASKNRHENERGKVNKQQLSKPKKVVVAYSGGLDTSIIIPWLKENYGGCDGVALIGGFGPRGDPGGAAEKSAGHRRECSLCRRPARRIRHRLHLADASRRRRLRIQIPARHLLCAPL